MKTVNLLTLVSGFFFCLVVFAPPRHEAEVHMKARREAIERRIKQLPKELQPEFEKRLNEGVNMDQLEREVTAKIVQGMGTGKGKPGTAGAKTAPKFDVPAAGGKKKTLSFDNPGLKPAKPAGAHEDGTALREFGERKQRPEATEKETKIDIKKEYVTRLKRMAAEETSPFKPIEEKMTWKEFTDRKTGSEIEADPILKAAKEAAEAAKVSGEEAVELEAAIRLMLKQAEAREKAAGKTLDMAEMSKIVKEAVEFFEKVSKEIPAIEGHENAGKNFTRNMLALFHRNPKALASQMKKIEGYLKLPAEERANILKGNALLVESFGEPFFAKLREGGTVFEAHNAGLKEMIFLMKTKGLTAEEMEELRKCLDGGAGGETGEMLGQGRIVS